MKNEDIKSLKDVIIQACSELLPMFGVEHKFMCELSENSLNSGEEINILIGLTVGLKGNILFGFTKESALKLASGMMGGMEITEIDEISKSALAEFANMLSGNALGKLGSESLIDISPPTVATGEDIFIMISRAPSKKLFFKMGESKFNIAYCLE